MKTTSHGMTGRETGTGLAGERKQDIQEAAQSRRLRRNPWVRDCLERSIWKEEEWESDDLKRYGTKEVTGKKRTIAVHMGKPLLSESIEVLSLSVRSHNCLKRTGIFTIDDLMKRISSEEDLLRIRNLGRKSADEILAKLEAYQKVLLKEPGKTTAL